MFNEWDRRCTTVQLMLSTDPSYDNRTIASTPQNANPDGSTLEGTAQRIGRPFGGGGAEGHCQENPDKEVHQKGAGNHWWNSPVAYLADCQRFRHLTHNCECMCEGDLKCRSYRHQTSQIWLRRQRTSANQVRQVPLLPRPEPAGLLRLVIRREHHQRDLPQHQSQPDRRHPPSICWAPPHLWKRHAPNSGSVSRRWLRLKVATLNRCQLYYIIKLPELIFSIKVLK